MQLYSILLIKEVQKLIAKKDPPFFSHKNLSQMEMPTIEREWKELNRHERKWIQLNKQKIRG
jgi:hypothetical protein